jgi:hypothetical protein
MTTKGRPRVRSERGQVLVLFLLIFITMVLIGVVAVVVGQTLVRRQHAQMIVDAAAFAGASKQAEGLNTIARWNKHALQFQQAIHVSVLIPYADGDVTTQERFILASWLWNDWAGDTIEDYQKVFDTENDIIDLANEYYSMINIITGPVASARKVVNANFGEEANGDRLFRGESPKDSGVLVGSIGGITGATKLVKLTEPEEYPIEGWTYVSTEMPEMIALCADSFGLDVYHCTILANYGIYNIANEIYRQFSPVKYKHGKFYEDDQEEVRFCYFLQTPNTPTIFGRDFFEKVPPITVIASAKPYGGYLGTKYDTWPLNIWTAQKSGKEIADTYKAKLVPVKYGELAALAIRTASASDPLRYVGVTH